MAVIHDDCDQWNIKFLLFNASFEIAVFPHQFHFLYDSYDKNEQVAVIVESKLVLLYFSSWYQRLCYSNIFAPVKFTACIWQLYKILKTGNGTKTIDKKLCLFNVQY